MGLPKIDLRQLLLCLREGKPAAFKRFYAGTLPQVTAHLRKLGLNKREDLEEVIQETYVEAYKSFRSLTDDQAALAWLLTIARRQWGRHLERSSRLERDKQEGGFGDSVVPEPKWTEAIHAQRLCAEVRLLCSQITEPRRRQVIEMFYFHEQSLAEISAATGIGASTLTTWLARFRRDVRMQLGDRRGGVEALPKAAWRTSP